MIRKSEYLTYKIWYDNFLEAQVYPMEKKLAAEKMAKNIKMSCSSKSRHIGFKVLCVTDKAKQGKVSVNH